MRELDLFPEVDTNWDDILDHENASDLKLRIFNTVAGSSILAIVLRETEDSFLVGLPCRLLASKDKKLIEPQMPVRFARFMKPTILYVTPCFGEFEIFYIKYLLGEGKLQYPEVITSEYEERLQERFNELLDTATKLKEKFESIAKSEIAKEEPDLALMAPPSDKYKH